MQYLKKSNEMFVKKYPTSLRTVHGECVLKREKHQLDFKLYIYKKESDKAYRGGGVIRKRAKQNRVDIDTRTVRRRDGNKTSSRRRRPSHPMTSLRQTEKGGST